MKFIKRLKKFIVHNWLMKLIILLLTAALWTFVASTQSTIGKFPTQIEIKSINVPTGYSAIYDQDAVSLKIMAEPAVWRSLSTQSFSAYIDLSNLEEGIYELPVSVTASVKDVQIVERDPERIMVRVEKNVVKTVPISARFEGSAAEGMIAGDATFSQQEAVVSGPESIINRVTEAICLVRLNGESTNFTKSIKLVALNDNGEAYKSIIFSPTEVVVNLQVIKASNNKTVGIKVNTTGNPKDGYAITKITVDPQTVNVIGPLNNLSQLNYVETADVDVSGMDRTFSRDVSLRLSAGTALANGQQSSVKITITFGEASLTRLVAAKISYENLDPSLRIKSIDPLEIKVLVLGSSTLLSGLSPNDVIIPISLSGATVGKNSITIDQNALQLKPGLSVINIVPNTISVTLENI